MPSFDLSPYIENINRSVFIKGTINEETVADASEQIIRLQQQSDEPITVYIQSWGGQVMYAEMLYDLLKQPSCTGTSSRTIGVCTSYAASAALDLYCLSDYAIAYKDALLHFHGVRRAHDEITAETAENLQNQLLIENERHANRLLKKILERFTVLYANNDIRNHPKTDRYEKFAELLKDKLKGNGKAIFQDAYNDERSYYRLTRHLNQTKLRKESDGRAGKRKFHVIAKQIFDYHVSNHKGKNPYKPIDASVFKRTQFDYNRFTQHYLDLWSGTVESVDFICQILLEPEVYSKVCKEHKETSKRKVQLLTESFHIIEPLWSLAARLSNRLQQSENPLNANDAYWLGLIDEVKPSKLPCIRTMLELVNKKQEQENNVDNQLPAKKSPAKKSPAKKSPAKKSPAKKSPAKKSPN